MWSSAGKKCLCVLSPQKTSWQRLQYDWHCSIAFTVCLQFEIFFNYEWVSNALSFPSYLLWMMSLIMIWTCYHSCRELTRITEDVGAWHEQTQTYKQAFLSLSWLFSSDISYSSGHTETANASFSSISDWYCSLKQRNNTFYCLLKRALVTSPTLFWRVEKFWILKCFKHSEQPHKKGRVLGKKTPGAALFLRAAASLLIENSWKKTLALRKKCYVDTDSKVCFL